MPGIAQKGTKPHIQSVQFEAAAGWTPDKIKGWMKDHDLFTDGRIKNEPARFRYRDDVIEKKNNKPSITLVIGFSRHSGRSEDKVFMLRIRTALKAMEENNPGCMKTAWAKLEPQEEKNMSLTLDLQKAKNVIRDLEFRVAKAESGLEVITKERDEATKALGAQKTASDEAAAAVQKDIEATEKRVLEAHEQALAKIADLEGKLSEGVKVLEAQTADLKKHKAALANPAFAAAVIPGSTEDIDDGGQAADVEPAKPKLTHWQQYQTIKEPAARTTFWNKYEKEIKEDQRKEAAKADAPTSTE